jgi:hypothetical protein
MILKQPTPPIEVYYIYNSLLLEAWGVTDMSSTLFRGNGSIANRILLWVRQIFEGLSNLHSKMIHRDIHRGNILVVQPSPIAGA